MAFARGALAAQMASLGIRRRTSLAIAATPGVMLQLMVLRSSAWVRVWECISCCSMLDDDEYSIVDFGPEQTFQVVVRVRVPCCHSWGAQHDTMYRRAALCRARSYRFMMELVSNLMQQVCTLSTGA